MLLLRLKGKHTDRIRLFPDDQRDEAVKTANEHVGEHSSIDGCSTPRQEQRSESVTRGFILYRTWRDTSFGRRMATLQPVTDTDYSDLF